MPTNMTKNSLWFLNLTLNAHQTRKRGKKTNKQTACNPKGSADLRQGKTTLPPRRRKSNKTASERNVPSSQKIFTKKTNK